MLFFKALDDFFVYFYSIFLPFVLLLFKKCILTSLFSFHNIDIFSGIVVFIHGK